MIYAQFWPGCCPTYIPETAKEIKVTGAENFKLPHEHKSKIKEYTEFEYLTNWIPLNNENIAEFMHGEHNNVGTISHDEHEHEDSMFEHLELPQGLFYFCKSVFMFMLNMDHLVIIDEVFHFIFFDGSNRFTSLAGLFGTIIKPFSENDFLGLSCFFTTAWMQQLMHRANGIRMKSNINKHFRLAAISTWTTVWIDFWVVKAPKR